MVPRQRRETLRPAEPRFTYSIKPLPGIGVLLTWSLFERTQEHMRRVQERMKPAAVPGLHAARREQPNLLRPRSKLLVRVEHAIGVLNAIPVGDDVHLSPGLQISSGTPQTTLVECGLKQTYSMAALSEAIRIG